MTFTIKIKGADTFTVEPGETILDAALRQGVEMPYSCQSGACSTCKGTVLSGHFDYGGFPITGIDPDNDENAALLCCAYPNSDMEVALTGDSDEPTPTQLLKAKVISRQALSDTLWQIRLQPLQTFRYRAGQYIELKIDGKSYPLSIANAPGNPYLEIHLQVLPEHPGSQQLLNAVAQHSELAMLGPLGSAYLREDNSSPIILVAGGSGFAPIKAIVERLFASSSKRDIYLYWGARTPHLLYLNETILRWTKNIPNLKYIPVISEPCDTWQGRKGLVHHAVLDDFADLSGFSAYLAGPFAMSYAARDDFVKRGMATEQIYADAFAFNSK
jgi:CDP-4-dehydro-6-deoxyglucose reductase